MTRLYEDAIANHARRIVRLRDGDIEKDEVVSAPVLAATSDAELTAAPAAS